MALGDIYMARLKQRWGTAGQDLENVFFYEWTLGAKSAMDVATLIETQLLPNINAIQTSFVKNVSVDVINMGDLGDFVSYPLTGAGEIIAQTLPPQNAISYTLKLDTRAVAKGGKRFAGVPESAQSDGVLDEAGYITDVAQLRTALTAELGDVTQTYKPIVVKRIKTLVDGTVPPKYRYRLSEAGDTLVTGNVVTVTYSHNVGSQNSRRL